VKGNLNVILDGRGPLTLRESNYVTSGGEGAVYRAGATIIKIYTDPAKMTRDGMADKVKALAGIHHPAIAAPAGLVTDEQRHPLGFHMPFVAGEPMPRIFTADFRARAGFDDANARALTADMRDATQCAHDNGAVMVDANEFNWIVDPAGFKPHVIDVDSWAIGRWPATVIMPSIRDWRAKTFDHATDWFSWGIVAFQVFTGIHPYKGRLDGYRPGELEKRMRDNASVFAPGVRLPHSARDPSCIPGPLLDWFRAEFQDGARTMPPSPLDTKKVAAPAVVLRAVISSGQGLIHEKLFTSIASSAVRVWPCGAVLLATGEVVDLDTKRRIGALKSPDGEVLRAGSGWLLADWEAGRPAFSYAEHGLEADLNFGLSIRGFFRADDRLFVITESELVEVVFSNPGRPVLTIGQRWGVRPNATRWFDGVAVQDVLGASFLIVPTKTGLVQARVKSLDGLTPIAGCACGRFAAIVASDKTGAYRRIEFTFTADMQMLDVWEGPNDGPDLNMTVLPKGVVATIVTDGELVIFVPVNGNINKIQDRGITTDLRLSRWGDKVTYILDGAVWRVQVK
jgi:hypothetical protein